MILDDIESTPKGSKIITLQGSQSSKYLSIIGEDLGFSMPEDGHYSSNSERNIYCISHDRTGFGGIDIIAVTEEAYTQVITTIEKHQIPFGTPDTLEALRIFSNKVNLPRIFRNVILFMNYVSMKIVVLLIRVVMLAKKS